MQAISSPTQQVIASLNSAGHCCHYSAVTAATVQQVIAFLNSAGLCCHYSAGHCFPELSKSLLPLLSRSLLLLLSRSLQHSTQQVVAAPYSESQCYSASYFCLQLCKSTRGGTNITSQTIHIHSQMEVTKDNSQQTQHREA